MDRRSRPTGVRRLALVAGALLLPGCGGGSKPEPYANEPGNFRVLMAGKPGHSKQTLSSAAGELSLTSMESVDDDQIRRIVVYSDLPLPIVQSSDPNLLLEGGIRGMSGNGQWTVEKQEPLTLDGHPGREVRFGVNSPSTSEKGTGKVRIFLIGNRLYQAIMVGPATKVNEEELDHFFKSFELLRTVSAIASTAPPSPEARAASGTAVAQAAPPSAPAVAPTPAPDPSRRRWRRRRPRRCGPPHLGAHLRGRDGRRGPLRPALRPGTRIRSRKPQTRVPIPRSLPRSPSRQADRPRR